jgi:hypothetical protein
MSTKPINPERRDPGILRKKSDVGLGNVENLSTGDITNIVLDVVKESINTAEIFTLEENDDSRKKVGIAQLKSGCSGCVITVGLIDPAGTVIEGLKIEGVYTAKDGTGSVEFRTLVTLEPNYLTDTMLQFYEKKDIIGSDGLCNIILDLPGSIDGEITQISVNIFQYTPGSVYLDTEKINDASMYEGWTLLEEVSCEESYLGVRHADISLGLAVYDESEKLVKIKVGDSLKTSDQDYNFPTINEVPFIAYKDVDIDGDSGRNITVPAKHKGPELSEAGEHAWGVLREHPQSGLVQTSSGFNTTVYDSYGENYGLVRISKYTEFPESAITSLNDGTTSLLSWCDSLSETNDDVVPVGAFREAIRQIVKLIHSGSSSKLSDVYYTFMFNDSGDSYSSPPVTGTTMTYSIISKKTTYSTTDDGKVEYPTVSLSGIDKGTDTSEDWITATLTGTGDSQKVIIGVMENTSENSRKGSVTLSQDSSGYLLKYNIYQAAGSSVLGFRVSDKLVPEGDTYILNKTSSKFSDTIKLYPVEVANGVESIEDYTDTNFTITKVEGDWLTVYQADEVFSAQGVDKKRKIISLSGSENSSTIASRTSILHATYKDQTITIQVTQEAAAPYITINGNTGTSIYYTEDLVGADTDSVVLQTNNAWTAVCSDSWLSINPVSGTSGQSILSMSCPENPDITAREATITITSSTLKRRIRVTQRAADAYLTLNGTSGDLTLNFTAVSETKSVTVGSNTSWQVNNIPSWITVSPASGDSSGSITLTATGNTSLSSRSHTLSITSESITRSISLTQAGANEVVISPTPESLEFGNAETTQKTITVTSNDSYTISASASWITLSATTGGTNGSLGTSSFKVSPGSTWTGAANRTGTVTLRSVTDPSVTSTISITQTGQIELSVSTSSLSFGAAEDLTSAVTISTNASSWSATSTSDWLTLTKTSSTRLAVEASENTTTSTKKASIKVVATEGSSSTTKTIDVTQTAGTITYTVSYENIKVSADPQYLTSSGGTVALTCKVDIKTTSIVNGKTGTTEVSTGQPKTISDGVEFWLSDDSETSDCSISGNTITIQENNGSKRSYIVGATYKEVKSGIDNYATISQAAKDSYSWASYSNLTIDTSGIGYVSADGGTTAKLSVIATKVINTVTNGNLSSSDPENVDVTDLVTYTFDSDSRPDTVPSDWVIQSNGSTIKFTKNSDGTQQKVAKFRASLEFESYSSGSQGKETIKSSMVSVTQKAADGWITITPAKYTFTGTGVEASFDIESNANWIITSFDSSLSKIDTTYQSGSGGKTIKITNLESNSGISATSYHSIGFSTVSVGTGSGASAVGSGDLQLNTKGAERYINFPDTITVAASEGAINLVDIDYNTSWEFTKVPDGITISPLTVSDPENSTSTSSSLDIRTSTANFWPYQVSLGNAVVTYKIESGTATKTISIIQEAASESITVPSSITVGSSKGSTVDLEVISNVDWKVSSSPELVTVSPSTGSASISSVDVVLTAVMDSSSTKEKTNLGTLVIQSTDGTISKSVTVYQDYANASIIIPSGDIWIGPEVGESKEYSFSTNYKWTAEITGTGSKTWELSQTSGSAGNSTIKLKTITGNTTTSDITSAQLKITSTSDTGNSTTSTINVIQRRAYPTLTVSDPIDISPKAGTSSAVNVKTNYTIDEDYVLGFASSMTESYTVTPVRNSSGGITGFTITPNVTNTSTVSTRTIGVINISVTDPLSGNTYGAPTVAKKTASPSIRQLAYTYYVDLTYDSITFDASGTQTVSMNKVDTNVDHITSEVVWSGEEETDWLTTSATDSSSLVVATRSRKWKYSDSDDLTLAYTGSSKDPIEFCATPRTGTIRVKGYDSSGSVVITKDIPVTQKGYTTCIVNLNDERAETYYFGGIETDSGDKICNFLDINKSGYSSSIEYSTWVYGYRMSYDSGEVTKTKVTAALPWNLSVTPSSEEDLVDVSISNFTSQNSALTNTNLLINVETGSMDKTGTVQLYLSSTTSNDTTYLDFDFTQPAPSATITATSLSVTSATWSTIPAAGCTGEIWLTCNTSLSEITVSPTTPGITLKSSMLKPSGSYVFTFDISGNNLSDSRSGSIEFIVSGNIVASLAYNQLYQCPLIDSKGPSEESDRDSWEYIDTALTEDIGSVQLSLMNSYETGGESSWEAYLDLSDSYFMEQNTGDSDNTYKGSNKLSSEYTFSIVENGTEKTANNSNQVQFTVEDLSDTTLKIRYSLSSGQKTDAYQDYVAVYKLYICKTDNPEIKYFFPIRITKPSKE